MAMPKKVLVDIDLLVQIFEYLNRLGDDEAFTLCDQILVKFQAILRREKYAEQLRASRDEALSQWLDATENKEEG